MSPATLTGTARCKNKERLNGTRIAQKVKMKFDDVLRQIGEFGPYQKRVYFLATAPTMLCAMEALSVIFVFYIPDHRLTNF
nr:hypothetical protein BaRGS_013742 [Batillaria attramentaria]